MAQIIQRSLVIVAPPFANMRLLNSEFASSTFRGRQIRLNELLLRLLTLFHVVLGEVQRHERLFRVILVNEDRPHAKFVESPQVEAAILVLLLTFSSSIVGRCSFEIVVSLALVLRLFRKVGHVEPASFGALVRIRALIPTAQNLRLLCSVFSFLFVFIFDLLFVGVSEEAVADERDGATENDRGEADERETGRDDQVAPCERLVDAQDETEGDGAPDQPRVPNEEELAIVERVGVLALVPAAELEKADEADRRHEAAENDDCHEDEDQADGEGHGAV